MARGGVICFSHIEECTVNKGSIFTKIDTSFCESHTHTHTLFLQLNG